MRRRFALILVCGGLSPAAAQDGDIAIDRPAVEDILACAALRGDAARLACFDAAAATLAEALGRSRPATAATPRPTPQASVLEDAAPSAERPGAGSGRASASGPGDASGRTSQDPDFDPNAVESREEFRAMVVEQRVDRFGDLYVRLDNGQRWKQTEGTKVFADDPPYEVTFERGFLGGYSMRIAHKDRAVRVTQLR